MMVRLFHVAEFAPSTSRADYGSQVGPLVWSLEGHQGGQKGRPAYFQDPWGEQPEEQQADSQQGGGLRTRPPGIDTGVSLVCLV